MKIEQLREDLIKDVVSYLEDDFELNHVLRNSKAAEIQNTITQIIVDSFDEYEVENNVPCSAELDYEFQNQSE